MLGPFPGIVTNECLLHAFCYSEWCNSALKAIALGHSQFGINSSVGVFVDHRCSGGGYSFSLPGKLKHYSSNPAACLGSRHFLFSARERQSHYSGPGIGIHICYRRQSRSVGRAAFLTNMPFFRTAPVFPNGHVRIRDSAISSQAITCLCGASDSEHHPR